MTNIIRRLIKSCDAVTSSFSSMPLSFGQFWIQIINFCINTLKSRVIGLHVHVPGNANNVSDDVSLYNEETIDTTQRVNDSSYCDASGDDFNDEKANETQRLMEEHAEQKQQLK